MNALYLILLVTVGVVLGLSVVYYLRWEPLYTPLSGAGAWLAGTLGGLTKSVGLGGVGSFVGDAFKTNPMGTITGLITLGSVVGVPVYKWIQNRSAAQKLQSTVTNITREKDAAEIEATQKIKSLTAEKESIITDYETKLADLKNDDVVQKYLLTQNELEATKKKLSEQITQNEQLTMLKNPPSIEQIINAARTKDQIK